LTGRDGDRINAVLAAAGYNFSLLLRWFEELLRVLSLILCHALLAAPLHLTRFRKTFFTADHFLTRAQAALLVRNLAQRVGAGRADTIAPVAELATKAPRGEARGTLGPGPGGPLGTISSVRHPTKIVTGSNTCPRSCPGRLQSVSSEQIP